MSGSDGDDDGWSIKDLGDPKLSQSRPRVPRRFDPEIEEPLVELDVILDPAAPRARPSGPLQIAFAGGKGGVGRSMLVANTGIFLSRLGKRAVVVDLDPSGLNLHTYLGLPPMVLPPAALVREEATPQVDRLPGTELRLVRPSAPYWGTSATQLRRDTLRLARQLDVDFILYDLGGHTDEFNLDLYLQSDAGVSIATPHPASMERLYAFLRTALYRHVLALDPATAGAARRALTGNDADEIVDLRGLLNKLGPTHSSVVEAIRRRVNTFRPNIVVNECRRRDDRLMLSGIVSALKRRWGVEAEALGTIDHDDAVIEAGIKRRPLLLAHPGTAASTAIERLARRLMMSLEREVHVQ
jgi:flagellar biosynthesis protein FlhG